MRAADSISVLMQTLKASGDIGKGLAPSWIRRSLTSGEASAFAASSCKRRISAGGVWLDTIVPTQKVYSEPGPPGPFAQPHGGIHFLNCAAFEPPLALASASS